MCVYLYIKSCFNTATKFSTKLLQHIFENERDFKKKKQINSIQTFLDEIVSSNSIGSWKPSSVIRSNDVWYVLTSLIWITIVDYTIIDFEYIEFQSHFHSFSWRNDFWQNKIALYCYLKKFRLIVSFTMHLVLFA